MIYNWWSGVFLFWPLFWLEGGDGIYTAEYSRLKSELMALKDVAIEKQCDPKIIPPDPEHQIKEGIRQQDLERKESTEPGKEESY